METPPPPPPDTKEPCEAQPSSVSAGTPAAAAPTTAAAAAAAAAATPAAACGASAGEGSDDGYLSQGSAGVRENTRLHSDAVARHAERTLKRRVSEAEAAGEKAMRQAKRQRRAEGAEYVYGNYDKYYGYRTLDSDHRVAALEGRAAELRGRTWLDVGCNNGQLIRLVAERLQVPYLHGIDIDPRLIQRAKQLASPPQAAGGVTAASAAAAPRAARTPPAEVSAGYYPASCVDDPSPAVSSVAPTAPAEAAAAAASRVPEVRFTTANISDRADAVAGGPYGVVSMLSVAKWIHLNFGDTGLKTAFLRVHELLEPGGYFVLEPQPWKSYRKAASKISSADFTQRRVQLAIRPTEFPDVLSKMGFEYVGNLLQPESETVRGEPAGFRRDLLLFRKKN
eukprot:Rhum_TRINITY_DN15378_c3_g1::Rhum_TRINITY_DN15378_c3_g1_i1::g.154297::m.154297/K15190/MEPCE, BCDIN3; 7SK snRNA methylphosphate capping enzyme